MKSFINTVILIGILVNISLLSAAEDRPLSVPGKFRECSDVWGVVSEYCDAPTISSLTRVSSKVSVEPRSQLEELRAWKENGGLLITLFGYATDKDLKNHFRLKGAKSAPPQEVAEYIKEILLSYIHISDPFVVRDVSFRLRLYIETRSSFSQRQKYQLQQLLPSSQNYQMGQLLTGNNYEWLDGESLDVSVKDKEKILTQLLKRSTQLTERPNEISSVLLYLYNTPSERLKYYKAFVSQWLEVPDITLSDLWLIQAYSFCLGYYGVCEEAVNRTVEHKDAKGWMKWYLILIAKPFMNRIVIPVMGCRQSIMFLSRLLFRKVWQQYITR